MPRNWFRTGLVAAVVSGLSLLQAQDALPLEGGSRITSLSVTGTAQLKNGELRKGLVEFKDGALLIRPAGEEARAILLEEAVRFDLKVEPVGKDNPDPLRRGALPSPWRSKDIGRVVVPGRTRWQDDQFVVFSSPCVEDERFDAFHLVYMPIKGDGEIVARVVSLDNDDEESYAGIVMCDGLTPENRKAVLGIHPHGEGGLSFRRWGYQGGSSTGEDIPSLKLPYWVKLVREKYDVTAYYSPDGRRWRFLKVSEGKMRDELVYVGLAVRVAKFKRLSETVIDHVSVNGVGSTEAEPMLPSVVLRSGSRLASNLATADRSAFHLSGRWEGTVLTVPQVARIEFYHPLPADLQELVQGERRGLLLRSGDFSEGRFDSLAGGSLKLGSVLLGMNEHSILDEVDALVLRKVVEAPASYRVETQAGSVLLAQKAAIIGSELVVEVAGLGEARIGVAEVKSLQRK
jgi:hypothetical protein